MTDTLEHDLFGVIDLSAAARLEGSRIFDGRFVSFDLNIKERVDASSLAPLLARVDQLDSLDARARAAMRADLAGGDETATALYVSHHLDELSSDAVAKIFGDSDPSTITPATFLSTLVLTRVGLYPESLDRQLVLDYSIGTEHTNYLLCVSFDESGEIAAVDMES